MAMVSLVSRSESPILLTAHTLEEECGGGDKKFDISGSYFRMKGF